MSGNVLTQAEVDSILIAISKAFEKRQDTLNKINQPKIVPLINQVFENQKGVINWTKKEFDSVFCFIRDILKTDELFAKEIYANIAHIIICNGIGLVNRKDDMFSFKYNGEDFIVPVSLIIKPKDVGLYTGIVDNKKRTLFTLNDISAHSVKHCVFMTPKELFNQKEIKRLEKELSSNKEEYTLSVFDEFERMLSGGFNHSITTPSYSFEDIVNGFNGVNVIKENDNSDKIGISELKEERRLIYSYLRGNSSIASSWDKIERDLKEKRLSKKTVEDVLVDELIISFLKSRKGNSYWLEGEISDIRSQGDLVKNHFNRILDTEK